MDSGPSSFGSNFSRTLRSEGRIFQSIAKEEALPDYATFMFYATSHNIRCIPLAELIIEARLGSGAFMVVYKAFCPQHFGDTTLAVKRIKISLPQWESELSGYTGELREMLDLMSLELRVLSNDLLRHHPNIIRLLGISWEELSIRQLAHEESATGLEHPPSSIAPVLVLERASCTLRELYNDVGRQIRPQLPLDDKVSLWCDVANALSAVHWLGVIHGDVKPENILIFHHPTTSQLIAKLSDFGGCQPLPDEDGRGVEYRLRGTEYWNAPEAYDEASPYYRQVLRDYYSFGMVGAYILFEEELFGTPRERTLEERVQMRQSKQNHRSISYLIEARLRRRLTFVKSLHAKYALSSLPQHDDPLQRFRDSLVMFRTLFARGEVQPAIIISKNLRQIQVVDQHDNRAFVMCFAMTQFLNSDPEERRQDKLLDDLRDLIEDIKIGENLAMVFGAHSWQLFLQVVNEGMSIWNISAIGQGDKDNVRPRLHLFRKVPTTVKPSDLMLASVYYREIPRSLREELMGQLARKVQTTQGAERADYLISFMTSKMLQTKVTKEEFTMVFTEAARLGSHHAKWAVINSGFALPTDEQSSERHERNRWTLELVLGDQECAFHLIAKLEPAIPDLLSQTSLFEDLRAELRAVSYTVFLASDLGNSPFEHATQAIADGNINRLRRVVEHHMDTVLSERFGGHTLLHVAARLGQPESALCLVHEYNVDMDLQTDDGLTALSLATIYGNTDTLYALVNAGANLQYVLTPRILRLVANGGRSTTLRFLEHMFHAQRKLSEIEGYKRQNADQAALVSMQAFLDCDVPPELDDQPSMEPQFSPLCAAILGDNAACLRTLLEMGCSTTVYAPFSSSSTVTSESVVFRLAPIHLAASQLRPWHLAILLQYSKNPELCTDDEYRQVPLHLACTAYRRVVYKYPDLVPADQESPSPNDIDPASIINTRLFMIRILVKAYGADVDAQDANGRTALFFCMTMPHCLPVMRYLVYGLKADVRVKDYIGQTCLHHAAVLCPEPEYLEFCVTAGCEINERDHHGATALAYAERRDDPCFAQMLHKHGAVL